MQMSLAVCDVHDSTPLQDARIALDELKQEAWKEDALRCQNPDCYRSYSPGRGYFWAKPEEYINQGVPSLKPQCRHNSEPVYMFLMAEDGKPLWACPQDGCQVTRPFQRRL